MFGLIFWGFYEIFKNAIETENKSIQTYSKEK